MIAVSNAAHDSSTRRSRSTSPPIRGPPPAPPIFRASNGISCYLTAQRACPPRGAGVRPSRGRPRLDHASYVRTALEEARLAAAHGDIPIGAVVVHEREVIARAHNRREVDQDPTAHAELLALREAARRLGRWRLDGCTLYVTLEPCAMCAGATVLARIDRLVFGADDPKAGAAGALWDIPRDPRLNHRVEVVRGVEAETCGALLADFFAERRRETTP
ncbi:MAG: tRNA adenosine(34) deaminase TadA [Actinobacteria bacterium]|nr:tRNA adenosine(34) deaminase TadA [Actinomycetota bacterium]